MGDYAITKIILKVKKEYQEKLEAFINFNKSNGVQEEDYSKFWDSLDTLPFYYQDYVFGKGSSHAYTTSLGDSDYHDDSDFYVDDKFTTRFEDGFWFVEFSSKVGRHYEFYQRVVPYIADAWLGLTGDEYSPNPTRLSLNPELIVSSIASTQNIIHHFRKEYNYRKSTSYG